MICNRIFDNLIKKPVCSGKKNALAPEEDAR
jgi:hypothetical protein